MPSATKLKSQQTSRRRRTLFKKTHQFAKLCGAKAGTWVYKNGRFHIYRSGDKWPTLEEIVCLMCIMENKLTS